MAHLYFDSSALVKRYVTEHGSIWVRGLLAPAQRNQTYTVRITGAEIIAAVVLRSKAGVLTPGRTQAVIRRFKVDFRDRLHVVEVTQPLVEAAMSLAERHALRGYDSVQLAAALTIHPARGAARLRPLIFVCADERLNEAARREGLTVENPNDHQ
jgi:predicted nucleic acid-binding protein